MIRRTIKTEGEAWLVRRNAGGKKRATRSSADAFSETVGHPDDEHLRPCCDKGKERACYGRERITEKNRQLSRAEPVAQITRDQFEKTRHRFRCTLDQADGKR